MKVPLKFAFSFALLAGTACAQDLKGIIDTHVHCDPDSAPRSVDCLEAAKLARAAGMGGLLFKNHYEPTVQIAYIIAKVVPDLPVFGGIVLNRSVGGINPEAVIQAATFKGGFCKVVWMPTFDAGNDQHPPNRPYVAVSHGGKLLPEVIEVLKLIKKYDLSLATGHISAEENLMVIHAAHEMGIEKMVATHPSGKMSIPQMKQAAADGAYIEFVYHSLLGGGAHAPTIDQYVREIRAVGPEHCILSSDLGQADSPVHPEGWKKYLTMLKKAGISDADIDLMTRRNPRRFLGMK